MTHCARNTWWSLLFLVVGCTAHQKPTVAWTDPDQNRCGRGSCIPSEEWMAPAPNPCPCPSPITEGGKVASCQRQAPWPDRQAEQPGHAVEVTHAYPQWPWPATYESTEPVFFLRINRIVQPSAALAMFHVVTDDRGWRRPQWQLVRCMVEESQGGGFTSLAFRMTECIPPGTAVTWRIGGGGDWRLGPPVAPDSNNGSYLYHVFRTHDPQHPQGSQDPFWDHAQLVSTHGPVVTQAKLQEQRETLALLERLDLLGPGAERPCGPSEEGPPQASAAVASASSPGPACQQAAAIYVTDIGTRQILRMAPDGSDVRVLVSGVEANEIDLDVAGGKMYWVDHDKDIMRANLDGSGAEVLLKDMPSPYGLALDLHGQRVVWTNQLGGPIVQSSTPTGADVRALVPGKGNIVIGIAVDPVHRALYWMDGYYGGHVVRAYVDGGNPKPIATTVGIANGVDVDPAGGKVYWTEYGNGPDHDAIRRANLDGSRVETLLDARDGLATPQHIAVDPAAGKLYWTDIHAARVQRSNLDGSGLETIRSGMGSPRGIALLRHSSCDEAHTDTATDAARSASSADLAPRDECAEFNRREAEEARRPRGPGECPHCPCACMAGGRITCAPCVACVDQRVPRPQPPR